VTVPLGRLVWRLVSRHRRSLAGLLVAVAVLLGLSSVAPARPRLRPVVVAARDLPAGQVLAAADLRVATEPGALAPDGSLTDPGAAAGHALAGAVRRGEPLTDLRLVGPGLLAGPGLVLAPVRMADAAEVALVHVGDVIDVLAAATP
jgi:pilus assembly protein CpaB